MRTLAIGSWAMKPFGLQLASRCLRQQVRRPVVWFSPRTASIHAARHAFRTGLGYLRPCYARMGRFSQSTRWSCRRAVRMAQSSNCRSDCLLHVPHASAVSAHTCYVRLSSRRPSREQSPSAAAVAADAAAVAVQPSQRTLQPLQCSRCSGRCSRWIGSHPWGCPTRPQVDYPNLSKMCTDLEAAIKVRASHVRAARTLSSSAGDC